MAKVTAGDGSALSFLCARVLENIAADPSPPVTRPASAFSLRADPAALARGRSQPCAMTNEFVIRDSAKASSSDRHLAAPSNEFLTAAGASIGDAKVRTATEMH
jgi:hypothetical protein